MAWVRLDDGFPEHPKLRAAGPLGRELFVAALCHCNRFLTDGRLTMADLRRLGQYDDLFVDSARSLPGIYNPPLVEEVLEQLISVGAMHYDTGYVLIHDYEQYQPTKAQVLTEREAARERKRKSRASAGLSVSKKRMSQQSPGREVLPLTTKGSKRHARERDFHFEALVDACGIDATCLTKSGRAAVNGALEQLRSVGATPEEIARRAAAFQRRYQLPLTPMALAKHWASLAQGIGALPDPEAENRRFEERMAAQESR